MTSIPWLPSLAFAFAMLTRWRSWAGPTPIILPGTKSTIADLAWLEEQGLAQAIRGLAETGVAVVGICGGYQMLGRVVRDLAAVESDQATRAGLGLLPIETDFEHIKTTRQVTASITGGPGWIGRLGGQALSGYEIHMGRTPVDRGWLQIATERGSSPVGGRCGQR